MKLMQFLILASVLVFGAACQQAEQAEDITGSVTTPGAEMAEAAGDLAEQAAETATETASAVDAAADEAEEKTKDVAAGPTDDDAEGDAAKDTDAASTE